MIQKTTRSKVTKQLPNGAGLNKFNSSVRKRSDQRESRRAIKSKAGQSR